MSALEVPADADPVVSLLMVVHGDAALARATLRSLADTVDVAAEVVIVDNHSPDGAGDDLARAVKGATVIRWPENLGYGTAANLAAAHAKGRYLAILNSDLSFGEGWLSSLVSALETDPAAGAAAPLYLTEAGAVLDAGGMMGADAHGYSYGDRFSPGDGEVNFVRRIDYGTAAALVVRAEAFDAVGGFDPMYGLGYFEDTDLGFSLRRVGFHSIYVPSARVRHAHGGSFSHALRREQLDRNRPRFAERFAEELTGRPEISRPPYDPRRELVLRDWWSTDRLLVIDPDGELGRFADEAQGSWPSARVTVLGSRRAGDRGGDPRVERLATPARLDGWLKRRRHHYGVVLMATDSAGQATVASLRKWQQQASVVAIGSQLPGGGELDQDTEPASVLPRLGFGPADR